MKSLALVFATVVVLPLSAAAQKAVALPDFTALVKQQGPAVVNVIITARAALQPPGAQPQLPDDPFFDFFRRFMPDLPERGLLPPRPARGIGSDFIISADGYILTNAHVVAGTDEVTVRLADAKREFKAKVIGADERTDVALIKVDATGLPVAKLGKSSLLEAGQWVAAIGSPFGFANTITAGIVSATQRSLPAETYVPFIQTDVAVNPGNSGGPLINLAGEVVGINSMIYSGTGGYMGVSFAIPIEVALDISRQLRETGKVTRGRLGIGIQPLTKELAESFRLDSAHAAGASLPGEKLQPSRLGLSVRELALEERKALGVEYGLVVTDVSKNLASTLIRPGDVIVAVGQERFRSLDEFNKLIASRKEGESVALLVRRGEGALYVPMEVG